MYCNHFASNATEHAPDLCMNDFDDLFHFVSRARACVVAHARCVTVLPGEERTALSLQWIWVHFPYYTVAFCWCTPLLLPFSKCSLMKNWQKYIPPSEIIILNVAAL